MNKSENKNIDLFSKYGINLNIVCGKNGTGKSTLIEILQQPYSLSLGEEKMPDAVFIFRDEKGNFASTYKTLIHDESNTLDLLDKNKSYSKSSISYMNLDDTEGIETNRKRVNNYITTPQIYDNILSPQELTPFFTNFRIKPFKETVKHLFELEYGNISLKNLSDYFELEDISRNSIYLSAVLLELENPDYISFLRSLPKEDDLLTSIKKKFKNKEIEGLEKEIKEKEFSCNKEDLKTAIESIRTFFQKVYESIYSVTRVNTGESKEIILEHLSNVVYLEGYIKRGEKIIHIYDYSAGEIRQFDFRSQLGRALSNNGGYLIYKDEAQNSLHPEWCRTFINDFVQSFKTISKYCLEDKGIKHTRKTVVFATHSPFFLSDVTNDNVIYLVKKNNEVISENNTNNIFAGNIGELFYSNFFMDETIGEFAKNEINKVLGELYRLRENEQKLNDDSYSKYKVFFELIGDKVLKKILISNLEDLR